MNKNSPLVVYFYCDTDLVHTSFVAAGLKALEKDGLLKLKYKVGTGKAKGRNGLLFSQYITIPSTNRTIVFDMHDQADYFFPDYLEDRSIEYYKTNFNRQQITNLDRPIKPFVPYFPIKYSFIHWKQVLGFYLITFNKSKNHQIPFIKNIFQTTAITAKRIKRLKQRGNIDDYFERVTEKNGILFTPGCWPEQDEFQVKANQERYVLIKMLKEKFSTIFKGGFPTNKVSLLKYHDALADTQKSHHDYIKNINSAKVNIYTSGLNNCVSWRLGELISSGSFIVGPKLPYEFLFSSLLKNYRFVEKEDPLAYSEKCNSLLAENEAPLTDPATLLNPKNVLTQIIFKQ